MAACLLAFYLVFHFWPSDAPPDESPVTADVRIVQRTYKTDSGETLVCEILLYRRTSATLLECQKSR